jgi:hypothetical protein
VKVGEKPCRTSFENNYLKIFWKQNSSNGRFFVEPLFHISLETAFACHVRRLFIALNIPHLSGQRGRVVSGCHDCPTSVSLATTQESINT